MMKVSGTVAEMKRTENSVMGNPSWTIYFSDGMSYKTSENAGVSYAMGYFMEGKPVTLVLNNRGRVVGIEK